jgi:hypothetical protein
MARTEVIANGIRLDRHPPLPAPSNETPRLVFVGHPRSPWHGLDHVVELAQAAPDWRLDVIGPGRDEAPDAPPNITFHGTLTEDAYLPVLAAADVAVGSLGLYRNQMEEASPLKVRESLARGIPTIIGYRDTDFPDPVPFLLQIPNRPDGVMSALGEIRGFVAGMRGARVPREAVMHLDVSVKEARRLELLREVAATRRRSIA